MNTQRASAPAIPLPSPTVPRHRYEEVKKSRDMYQRLYIQDRSALAAARQEIVMLRQIIANLRIAPGAV